MPASFVMLNFISWMLKIQLGCINCRWKMPEVPTFVKVLNGNDPEEIPFDFPFLYYAIKT